MGILQKLEEQKNINPILFYSILLIIVFVILAAFSVAFYFINTAVYTTCVKNDYVGEWVGGNENNTFNYLITTEGEQIKVKNLVNDMIKNFEFDTETCAIKFLDTEYTNQDEQRQLREIILLRKDSIEQKRLEIIVKDAGVETYNGFLQSCHRKKFYGNWQGTINDLIINIKIDDTIINNLSDNENIIIPPYEFIPNESILSQPIYMNYKCELEFKPDIANKFVIQWINSSELKLIHYIDNMENTSSRLIPACDINNYIGKWFLDNEQLKLEIKKESGNFNQLKIEDIDFIPALYDIKESHLLYTEDDNNSTFIRQIWFDKNCNELNYRVVKNNPSILGAEILFDLRLKSI